MPSLRRLVPSVSSSDRLTSQGEISSTPGGGSSSSAPSGGSGGKDNPEEQPRKRRTPSSVTHMACSECRHARQKCDGIRPDPCTRCLGRNLNCHYEPHTKTHKDDLLREIRTLRSDNTRLLDQNRQQSDATSDLAERHRGLQISHDWQRVILDAVGSNGHDREIIHRLRAGDSIQSVADWLCQQDHILTSLNRVPPSRRSLIDIVQGFDNHYRQQQSFSHVDGSENLLLKWTSVTSNLNLLNHLFDLYFTWTHPVHMLFSEMDFKESFRNNDETYCSSCLVNSVCAMACHLLDKEDIDGGLDISTLMQAFMNEAKKGITPQESMPLTCVQALAVMYLVELSSNKARSAIGYLRACMECLQAAKMDGQSFEAREISLWGMQTINTSSTGITYQKLYAPTLPQMDRSSDTQMDRDDVLWRFYRRIGDGRDLPFRPGHALMTAGCQAGLFRIIHESIDLYCGLRGLVTAEAVLKVYRRYIDWEADLNPIMNDVDISMQPLPHVLFLHIQFHTAVIQHINPVIQCGYFTGENLERLRKIVVYHAQSAIETLEHYRQIYSTRYLMPLMAFCIVHVGDVLVRHSPNQPPAADVVEFCLGLLDQAGVGLPICGPLQDLFRRTAVECNVPLPKNSDHTGRYGMDDILDACTRLDYKQPLDQSVRHVDSRVAQDWPEVWEAVVSSSERPQPLPSSRRLSKGDSILPIDSLLNK